MFAVAQWGRLYAMTEQRQARIDYIPLCVLPESAVVGLVCEGAVLSPSG